MTSADWTTRYSSFLFKNKSPSLPHVVCCKSPMYESNHFGLRVMTSLKHLITIRKTKKNKYAQRYQIPQLAQIMEGKKEWKKGWESNPILSTFKGVLYSHNKPANLHSVIGFKKKRKKLAAV